jgi:hypothetical protein
MYGKKSKGRERRLATQTINTLMSWTGFGWNGWNDLMTCSQRQDRN